MDSEHLKICASVAGHDNIFEKYWSPCSVRNWELQVHFKVHGRGKDLYGDGFAIWYAKDRMIPGLVFGNMDFFQGLAVILDTYSNHNGPHNHQHPYISAMVNNGSLHYDHDRDGTHTQLAGCEAKFRNLDHDTHIRIRYERDVLTEADVKLYSQVPKANTWIFNKSGLSTSEWVTCLKMNANLTAVRGVPGRSLDRSRCRHGCPETETLGIQDQCNRGLLLRNARHHHVRFLIATALRKKSWIVEEEIFCIATNGSSRRIDIIAYSQTTKKGYIIDPTIRIETGVASRRMSIKKRSIFICQQLITSKQNTSLKTLR
ncbi:hypothetical protein ANN_02434 [Periplaneta americana]|uniref:L-type lectin-like domain-containing protein n=1 Tax=Periplaneta americana TaxID=6978 RepID=A0ABQ8TXD2_PERAM|nr:hypothetical protein ANN_02434 [Periplaneta americana]